MKIKRPAHGPKRSAADCPVPPHPAHRVAVEHRATPAAAAKGTARLVRWMAAAPAERASLPGAAALWGSGAVLAAAHVPPDLIGALGLGAGGVAYGTVLHHTKDVAKARKAGLAAGFAGGWLAAAAELGPLAGPDHLLTLVWVGASGIGYMVLRRDELVRARREHRAAKAEWHRMAVLFGLHGSHLLKRLETRLGEEYLIDVKGTGKRATALVGRDLGERIAEHYSLPHGRVAVGTDRIAGRIRINIRHRDPWGRPVLHPLLDAEPEIDLPAVATVREPLVIGQDPETGKPLTLEIWDEDIGGMHTLVVSQTGGGKTVLLNDICERLTAAGDAVVWPINISKAKETRRWAPACDLTAIGPSDRAKALKILRLAKDVIDYRGASASDDAVFQPSPETPLLVIPIDEMDTLVGGWDPMAQRCKEALGYVQSKGRSEGVVVVACAQRGTVSHTGDSDIRTQFRNVILGTVSRSGEAAHAAGDMGLDLDIKSYGEGHPGVIAVANLATGTISQGRTFMLKHLPDIDRIVTGRRAPTLEPGLIEHLGDKYAALKGSAPAAVTATQAAFLSEVDHDLEDAMPDDLRADMEATDGKLARARQIMQAADAIVIPPVPEDKRDFAAYAQQERRAQAEAAREEEARQIDIPAGHRGALLALLGDDGTTTRDAAAALGVPYKRAWGYLHRLRMDGLVAEPARGTKARWRIKGGDTA